LFWGEPLDGVRERIERLKTLSRELGREHAPLEFGLRVTTLVRDSTEKAWDVAKSLQKYAGLGITHFVLSDTPYLREIKRQGGQLLPLLRG
jgi:alkanesulfonate monooxygenase